MQITIQPSFVDEARRINIFLLKSQNKKLI